MCISFIKKNKVKRFIPLGVRRFFTTIYFFDYNEVVNTEEKDDRNEVNSKNSEDDRGS